MVALLRPLSAAAAATFLLAPAAPPTGSAVAASAVGGRRWRSVRANAGGGWLSGLLGGKGGGASTAMAVTPGTVKAGDPVLHEPAQEVAPGDVRSEKVQGVIDRMVDVMRKAPGVGLAAPQIGVPLRVWLILRFALGVRLLVFNHQGHPISRQRCCPVTNVLMFLRINHRITDYCSRGYARVHQLCTQEGHRSTRSPSF